MPTLTNYKDFAGRHWETGTIHNYLAYRNLKAPHTGQPYSEAFLLGISGGITFGYFTFAYKGYDPQCNILTRNTFDPWDTMLSRLGVEQNIIRTSKPEKAVINLTDTLEAGVPAIVWADMWGLPYNALEYDAGMWGMFPILVYGYEDDVVHIADRAQVSLTVTPTELATARGRVKKDKFKIITLEAPNSDKLKAAVTLGITDTIKIFTEKPPKGSKNNFGLTGMQFWAKNLTNPKLRTSWHKQFPAGSPLFSVLTSAYNFALLWSGGDGERGQFADFLDEAALLLNRPELNAAAAKFREAVPAWEKLGEALLPASIPSFHNTKQLMDRRAAVFREEGNAGIPEMRQIDAEMKKIKEEMATSFPLNEAEVVALQEKIANQLLEIHDLEEAAISILKTAMS